MSRKIFSARQFFVVFLLITFSIGTCYAGQPEDKTQFSVKKFLKGFFSPQANAQTSDGKEDWDTSTLGKDSKKLLREARSYSYLRAKGSAKEKYDVLMRRHPDNPFILNEAAEVYVAVGDLYRAEKYFAKAAFLRPYDNNMRLAWPRALENYGYREKAVKELNKIIEEDPEFLAAKKEMGDFLNWQQQWDASVAVYDQVLAEDPDDVDALLKKAQVLNWAGKTKDAIVVYEQVVIKDPTNSRALKELAQIYSELQSWTKASEAYEKLLASSPNDTEVLEELGNTYFYNQKYGAAEKVYSQLSDSNPDASRRISSRFSQINLALAPTLAHSFLFYQERNRQGADRGVPNRIRSESVYNTLEYAHPITAAFKAFVSASSRHDDTHKTTSFTYGVGLQSKLFEKVVHRIDLKWETKNLRNNPRWGLRNSITWIPKDRWEVSLLHHHQTYWDPSRNRSNTLGFGISRAFLKQHNLLMSYRFTYDIINDVSDFFVSIENTDGNLTLITNTLNMEKYWTLTKKLTMTTGTSYDVTDEGRNTLSLYGSLSYRLMDRMNLVAGTSWSRDNSSIEATSASSYISYRF